MMSDALFTREKSLTIFTIVCLIIIMYLIINAFLTYLQEIWLNEKLLSLEELPLFAENCSIKNAINRDEILVCVIEDDYKTMDADTKSKLHKIFITDDIFELYEISPVQYGSFGEPLTLKECFDKSIPLYLSCVPSPSHGTFIVKDFCRDFRRLYDVKTQRKNNKAFRYVLGAGVCACVFFIGDYLMD